MNKLSAYIPYTFKHVIACAVSLVAALYSVFGYAQERETGTPAINIAGAPSRLEANIRAHLTALEERCDSTRRRLNRQIPTLRASIERAAQALGYYQIDQELTFQIQDPPSRPCWQLDIQLDVGAPVRVGNINVDFTDDTYRSLFAPVLNNLPMNAGEQLNHAHYEQLKSQLNSQANAYGLFDAQFTRSELAIDLEHNLAHVYLTMDPGNRYRFGDINIRPLEELSDNFVSSFLTLEPGTDYASDALSEVRENYNNSRYFQQVAVTPQLSRAQNDEVPVDIELSMRPRRSYTTGIGVSTDVGPRLRFAYEDRYANRHGHRLNADLAVSPLQQEPSVTYLIPLSDPINDSLRLSAGFQRQDAEQYTTNTYQAGVTYRSLVWENWVQNIFVNYQHERAELNDVQNLDTRETRTNTTIFGINWARTRSNDAIYPTRGWRLFGQLSGAHENLLSDSTFAQVYGSAKLIHPVGPGRLLLRGEAATTFADSLVDLPLSVRFFTGGDLSVRSYQFGELGATNSKGEVVGGKHLLVGSIEYDIRVYGDWLAAAFVDSGNSFQNFDDMKLKHSAGLGIRWLSPIGPIRLDLAKGLDDGGFRLHLTMGPDL